MRDEISIFLGDSYLGQGWRERWSMPSVLQPGLVCYGAAQSIHYYCQKCGNVWARLLADAPSAQHHYIPKVCEACWDGSNFRPPLLADVEWSKADRPDLVVHLSQEAMRRDLLLLFNKWSEDYEQETSGDVDQ